MANKSLGASAAAAVSTTSAYLSLISAGYGQTSNQGHFQVQVSASGVTIWYSSTGAAPYSLFDSTHRSIPINVARELADEIFRFTGTSSYKHWLLTFSGGGITITYSPTANGTFGAYGVTGIAWTQLQRGLAECIWQVCGA